MAWECGINGCGKQFTNPEAAVAHQVRDHERSECKVCGSVIPDGYLAIFHTFTEHTRAEYVRAYGADSSEVRQREAVLGELQSIVDVDELSDQLNEGVELPLS